MLIGYIRIILDSWGCVSDNFFNVIIDYSIFLINFAQYLE